MHECPSSHLCLTLPALSFWSLFYSWLVSAARGNLALWWPQVAAAQTVPSWDEQCIYGIFPSRSCWLWGLKQKCGWIEKQRGKNRCEMKNGFLYYSWLQPPSFNTNGDHNGTFLSEAWCARRKKRFYSHRAESLRTEMFSQRLDYLMNPERNMFQTLPLSVLWINMFMSNVCKWHTVVQYVVLAVRIVTHPLAGCGAFSICSFEFLLANSSLISWVSSSHWQPFYNWEAPLCFQVRKRSSSSLNYPLWGPQTRRDMSRCECILGLQKL